MCHAAYPVCDIIQSVFMDGSQMVSVGFLPQGFSIFTYVPTPLVHYFFFFFSSKEIKCFHIFPKIRDVGL